jgi:LuxR family maltose regulon positive regulatory protein
MAALLLKTKLHIPLVRPELVSRPRLLERLNAGLEHKLTLISAPAGFGKTTLLSEWIQGRLTSPLHVAWVSLDQGDNDPARFWTYCIAALQAAQAEVGKAALSMLQSSQPSPIEAILTTLINEILERPGAFALVLDDYHLIEAQPIHKALTFFLDHLPQSVHLVIAGRADPPLPLPRLRGKGQLAELREADLRFTPDEAAAFLNQVMGLRLAAEDVAALAARTEGWITGLQMAALSMQRREDGAGFIAAFTGSHRYILDYLVEEVLYQQPEEVQTFLLQTAILDRLTGPLCDAVTMARPRDGHSGHAGRGNSQEMLERLDADNLFIIPLDEERRWYRYHHLFTDLLRNQLGRTQPDLLPTLHRRASDWYERNGLPAEAVVHALAASDLERVAHLVEGNALAMMDHGELTTLVKWLDALPGKLVRSRPWLCVFYAWALVYTGQLDVVEARLQDAEKSLDDLAGQAKMLTLPQGSASPGKDRQAIEGHIAAIRAYVAASREEISQAIEFAHQALRLLPERDLMARSFATLVLGSGYRYSGDLVAASQALVEAVATSQAAGDSHLAILSSCNLAGQLIYQGQLRKAAAIFRDLLQPGDPALPLSSFEERGGGARVRRLPFTGLASTGLATVLREWNNLESAERLAREGLELSKQWGQAEILIHGYVELARVLQARENEDEALDAVQRARQIARGVAPLFVDTTAAVEAQLWLAQGDVAAAARWVQESGVSVDDELSFQHQIIYTALARVLIAQGKHSKALGLLARLLEVVEAAGAIGHAIENLVLQAIALQAQDEIDQALTTLECALALAEPEGYVRTFADEGARMAGLLHKAAAWGLYPHYVDKLLAAVESEKRSKRKTPSSSPSSAISGPESSSLIEPLSERETEVLRLIAAGLSNREIADELFLAVGTVKKHINNIFGKLSVRKRTQAVARARELGML